jgi:hypothetical protein
LLCATVVGAVAVGALTAGVETSCVGGATTAALSDFEQPLVPSSRTPRNTAAINMPLQTAVTGFDKDFEGSWVRTAGASLGDFDPKLSCVNCAMVASRAGFAPVEKGNGTAGTIW